MFTAAAATGEVASDDAKRRRIEGVQRQKRETQAQASAAADTEKQKQYTPKGTKNPLQPNERLACYRTRLCTTPAQYRVLRDWMHAGRWAFNDMVQRVRAGATPTDSLINECCKATRTDPRFRDIHRCVFRNGMLDVRAALKTENTKCAQDPRYRRGTVHFRSVRRTTTETVRLDAAVFKPDDERGVGTPKDTGPIRMVRRSTVPERDRPANRIGAEIHFGCNMKNLPPVIIRGRRWLIEKLVTDTYMRHEAKLHWDKRLHALYLIVTVRQARPPDPDPECREKRVVAMDPGVRRFQTYIDMSDGRHGVLLDTYQRTNHINELCGKSVPVDREIERRCRRIDALQAKVSCARH